MNYFFHSQDEKVTYHVLKLNENFKSLYDIAIIVLTYFITLG